MGGVAWWSDSSSALLHIPCSHHLNVTMGRETRVSGPQGVPSRRRWRPTSLPWRPGDQSTRPSPKGEGHRGPRIKTPDGVSGPVVLQFGRANDHIHGFRPQGWKFQPEPLV
jgi:hypothetical protein